MAEWGYGTLTIRCPAVCCMRFDSTNGASAKGKNGVH